jgi:hypothetical protein
VGRGCLCDGAECVGRDELVREQLLQTGCVACRQGSQWHMRVAVDMEAQSG